MPKLITISWREIPAQVIGRVGRASTKRELPPRFMTAIDRAAMRAGKGQSHLYLEEWRREAEELDGDVVALVEERVAAIERDFPQERLDRMVRAGGVEPRDGGVGPKPEAV